MDSGNSGSLQSSSGGDEEYDSRAAAESFSAFISHPLRLPLQPPPPPPPPFDPVSNYYFQIQNSNSPVFNPNMFLPRNMNPARSDQVAYSYHPSDDQNTMNSPFMPTSFQPATEVSDRVGPPPPQPLAPSSVAHNRTQNQNQAAARNPKKRSRASRRAPTTVLTTDTTNFRAMVQEFTGIPAPPFNSSAPFQRSRLVDLFSNTPLTSLIRSQPPPLIHRPFSQKVQSPPPQPPPPAPLPPPFLASTNSTSSSTSNNAAASSSTTPTRHHHHLSNDQNSNLFNISNPTLSSFLQNNHKFPFSSSINLGSKIQGPFQIPSNDNLNNKLGELDEFSSGHGNTVSPNLNALPNLISSDQIQPRINNHSSNNSASDDDLRRWRNNAVSPDEINHDRSQTRLVHGNYNFSRNGKPNPLGSTSNFHGEKEQENVANRNEGMVESWICSSE